MVNSIRTVCRTASGFRVRGNQVSPIPNRTVPDDPLRIISSEYRGDRDSVFITASDFFWVLRDYPWIENELAGILRNSGPVSLRPALNWGNAEMRAPYRHEI
jgi:hypothetical protein